MKLSDINSAEIILTKEEKETLQAAAAILDEIETASDKRFKNWDLYDEDFNIFDYFDIDCASWGMKQIAEGKILVCQRR